MKVLINFAITADGKIATKEKTASPFTSKDDLDRLLQIRKKADAIMVGRGTLEADQMGMTIPERLHPAKQPARVIVSRSGEYDFQHKVFSQKGGQIHLLMTERANEHALSEEVSQHRMSLNDFLQYAEHELGWETLLCEGGGELVHALAALDRIDEIYLTWAGHSLFGGREATTLTGGPSSFLPASREYELVEFTPLEQGECFLHYKKKTSQAHLK